LTANTRINPQRRYNFAIGSTKNFLGYEKNYRCLDLRNFGAFGVLLSNVPDVREKGYPGTRAEKDPYLTSERICLPKKPLPSGFYFSCGSDDFFSFMVPYT
jgi:hypothetical protein